MRWYQRWGLNCESKAAKVFRKRSLWTMLVYFVVILGLREVLKYGHPVGWTLYLLAVAPAIPLLVLLTYLGIYLRDETDEYLRTLAIRSLLVATGAVLATLVVNDFLRAFANVGPLPEFAMFVLFFFSFAAAQGVQQTINRGGGDD